MHPEILRELTAQHSRDLRDRAQRSILARSLRASRRAAGHARHAEGADEFVAPEIPDYVDGSFRSGPVEEPRAQVPAARRAA
jgi:hypothetical protein